MTPPSAQPVASFSVAEDPDRSAWFWCTYAGRVPGPAAPKRPPLAHGWVKGALEARARGRQAAPPGATPREVLGVARDLLQRPPFAADGRGPEERAEAARAAWEQARPENEARRASEPIESREVWRERQRKSELSRLAALVEGKSATELIELLYQHDPDSLAWRFIRNAWQALPGPADQEQAYSEKTGASERSAREPAGHDALRALGLAAGADAAAVKRAFKQQALLAHPDRGGSTEAFVTLMRVYEAAAAHVARGGADRESWVWRASPSENE